MDYAGYIGLGPIVNSFLLTFGPTIAPMALGSVAWEAKSIEWKALELEIRAMIQTTRAVWQGEDHDLWELKFQQYAQWLAETAQNCADTHQIADGINVAYSEALVTIPSFAATTANRIAYFYLATLFIFAIITIPLMVALDAAYQIMAVISATVMSNYSTTVDQLLTSVPYFEAAPHIVSRLDLNKLAVAFTADGAEGAIAAAAAFTILPPPSLLLTKPHRLVNIDLGKLKNLVQHPQVGLLE